MSRLTQEEYAARVGEQFRVELEGNSAFELTLSEVNGVGPQTTRQALEAGHPAPFSLIFQGPNEPILPQSIYRLTNATLGTLDLFLVPIGPDGDHMGYEAAFS